MASLSSISQSCASGPQIVSADSRQFDFFFHPAYRWWRWKDWRKQEWWTLHWQHSNYKLKIVICLKITWKCWLEWQKCSSGEELRISFSASYGSFCVCMSSDQEGEWRCGWIWSRIICWQLAVCVPSMYPLPLPPALLIPQRHDRFKQWLMISTSFAEIGYSSHNLLE